VHLGFAGVLPNWNIMFIRPLCVILLFTWCVYHTVASRERVPSVETVKVESKLA
jgi:hypothetical protein